METYKVLVIDDDPMTCSLLETILQMEDYQTASVNRIEPDLETLLNRERPDLLILDLHLGSDETLQHVVQLRASTGWRQLPILMTSAIDRRKECLQAGANAFMLKPFKWQEITRIMSNLTNTTMDKEV